MWFIESLVAFSALMLLVGWQEGHLAGSVKETTGDCWRRIFTGRMPRLTLS